MKGIQRYIERTKLSPQARDRYCMTFHDLAVLCDETLQDPSKAVIMAFEYGKAKGYRAAKTEKGATA